MRVLTIPAGNRLRSLLARGRGFLALSAGEQVRLVAAVAIVALVRLFLSVLPSRVSLRLVRRLAGLEARAASVARPPAEQLAWNVRAAARVVPGATCLTQAVAAQLMLRHYGYESALCLGVARSTGADFLAHAWIEHDERVLVGGGHGAAFVQLPALRTTVRRSEGAETR